MCDAHRSVDVDDHLSSGLVAFAMVGPFLLLLQHAVSGGSVLQCKLAEDLTEPVDADLPHACRLDDRGTTGTSGTWETEEEEGRTL